MSMTYSCRWKTTGEAARRACGPLPATFRLQMRESAPNVRRRSPSPCRVAARLRPFRIVLRFGNGHRDIGQGGTDDHAGFAGQDRQRLPSTGVLARPSSLPTTPQPATSESAVRARRHCAVRLWRSDHSCRAIMPAILIAKSCCGPNWPGLVKSTASTFHSPAIWNRARADRTRHVCLWPAAKIGAAIGWPLAIGRWPSSHLALPNQGLPCCCQRLAAWRSLLRASGSSVREQATLPHQPPGRDRLAQVCRRRGCHSGWRLPTVWLCVDSIAGLESAAPLPRDSPG